VNSENFCYGNNREMKASENVMKQLNFHQK